MGAAGGQPDPPVRPNPILEKLGRRPWDFSFFQAIRLLQRLFASSGPIGRFHPPANEAVRLGTFPSLSFPASEIQSLEFPSGRPPVMAVNFFGLTGPLGVLPNRYTEAVIERVQAGDTTLRDFLDIFNHRFISLLYRAWEKYRYPVPYERGEEDRFTGYMLDTIGLGSPHLRNRQAVPDHALIFYAGLLAQYPRSAAAFQILIAHFFSVPARVEPFAGSWRRLETDCQTTLDDDALPVRQLGVGMVLGDEVWDQQSTVRLRLGPLTLRQYRDFLPDGGAHAGVKALARFFCGCDLDVELQLVLKREEAPYFGLGVPAAPAPKLGWVSWISTRPPDRDPDETVIRLRHN